MCEKSKQSENVEPLDLEYLRTLDQWNSENDDRAYRDL